MLTRRFLAFIVDAIIIVVPIVLLTLFIALFGLLTFGIGWLLFFLLTPIAVLWAIVYTGATLGSPQSATIGMRARASRCAPGTARRCIFCSAPCT